MGYDNVVQLELWGTVWILSWILRVVHTTISLFVLVELFNNYYYFGDGHYERRV